MLTAAKGIAVAVMVHLGMVDWRGEDALGGGRGGDGGGEGG